MRIHTEGWFKGLGVGLFVLSASIASACATSNSGEGFGLTGVGGAGGGGSSSGSSSNPTAGGKGANGVCGVNSIAYSDKTLKACNACLDSTCCAEFTQLTNDLAAYPGCADGSSCPPLDDLTACGIDMASPACAGDPDAAAAAACQDQLCDATCPAGICNAGVSITGVAGCSACLGSTCCSEFEAMGCDADPQPLSCQTNLDDFNTCATDPSCNGNPVAQAAYACDTEQCQAECAM